MMPREHVTAAMDFRSTGVIPVEYHPSAAGYCEHGEKLRELWRRYPQGFGDFTGLEMPKPAPEDFDEDGRFHRVRTDW